jgi:nucleotidyltransferase/DNA polymerase involved in DNA repair
MATKNSNNLTMNSNKETIKKVSAKVHEELLSTSHLFIDETVATLTRMQKITGKVIKKSEPILEKQIDITFDAVEALANQASKGGKRALKLLGMTKQYNKLTSTISKKVEAIPSTEEMIGNAKDFVASAKSDVEETINKASKSIKKVPFIGDLQEEVKKISGAKAPKAEAKNTVKKAVKKVAKTAAKTTATAKKQVKKTVAKATTPQTASTSPVSIAVAKAVPAPKKTTAPKAAKKEVVVSELTQIKGIGSSLAAIMMDNGIKTIKDLQDATPTALKVIATKAGNRYKTFDTNQWIVAAQAINK